MLSAPARFLAARLWKLWDAPPPGGGAAADRALSSICEGPLCTGPHIIRLCVCVRVCGIRRPVLT
eukprot:1395287-Rhodomonas_salina.1